VTREVIRYRGRKVPVYFHQEIDGTCNGGEKVTAKLYAAVSDDPFPDIDIYLALDDKDLGKSVIKVEGGVPKADRALEEVVDVLCNQKDCRAGAYCCKKR